jgi:hypothetical protein
MKKIFAKLLSLLRVRASAAGLEVNDQVVRLARYDGKVWQMDAIRLEPGIVQKGKIQKRDEFIAVLTALKAKAGKKVNKKMNVVVCLSSVEAYTQVFSLPVVAGADLEKAVELNLQMASPLEAGQGYSGWQIVGRDEGALKIEILSSFIDRKVVDETADALFEAGFLVMAVESRALALTRLLREKGAGVDVGKPYVFVSIDDAGLDFLIIRNGALYFEYANPWRDLMDDKGDISVAKFETTLGASIRQVSNFYNQHWSEPLSAIILSAVALEEEAEKVIAQNASVPAARLTLVMGQPISSEWLVTLGCSLRGSQLKGLDREISLLGEDSRDRFHEEQLLHFMNFWRVIIPVTLGLLVLAFVATNIVLSNTREDIESRSDFNLNGADTAQVVSLEASSTAFNQMVTLMTATEKSISPKNVVLQKILTLAASNQVTINRLSFQSFGTPITFSGSAPTEGDVVNFKAALQSDPEISAINLPLTGIQTNGSTVTFSVTFTFTPQ